MSSAYRPICLDHNPPLLVDGIEIEFSESDPPPQPPGHEHCRIAVGRYSGALVEMWLPTPYTNISGQYAGRWYDVSWMRRFPDVAHAIANEQL